MNIHLCPICNVVEMQFVERIPSEKRFRLRRFKCPVCDHQEMYKSGGPDDQRRQERTKDILRINKFRELLYGKED